MIHRAGSYEFMLDKNGGRDRTLIQDVKTDANQILPVPFRKIRHRTDKSSLGLTQFGSAFGRRVLPHDNTVVCATGLLERAQCTQRTGIIDGAEQHMSRVGGTQMPAHRFKAEPEFSIPLQVSNSAMGSAG